jgi:dienelactone hydrolase
MSGLVKACTASHVVTIGALVGLLTGCVGPGTLPAHFTRLAGFQEDLVAGSTFRHRIYRRQGRAGEDAGVLHVYIEGDGRPFLQPTTVAFDPTPRDPLMLRLMALDPSPSVYLGRPCYFGLSHDKGCDPSYWTVRRFSPEVVDSLAVVLRAEEIRAGAHSIQLYGHSGGGTLAVLLAARIPNVTRVVTIGANLDTAAWCSLHGYTPLLGSLNPAELPHSSDRAAVLHLVGSKDTNTPPELVESAAARAGESGAVRIIPGFTHTCCWEGVWARVLRDETDSLDEAHPRDHASQPGDGRRQSR